MKLAAFLTLPLSAALLAAPAWSPCAPVFAFLGGGVG